VTETVIHMVGHVGTAVDHRQVGTGTDLSTFRLATTPRRWDRNQRRFVDGTTSWISVQCWRSLAVHVRDSVGRGDPVVVVGRLKTEEWVKDGVKHSRFILEASTVGHDLSRGVSRFRRSTRPPEPAADDSRAAVEALQDIEGVEHLDEGGGDAAGALSDAS